MNIDVCFLRCNSKYQWQSKVQEKWTISNKFIKLITRETSQTKLKFFFRMFQFFFFLSFPQSFIKYEAHKMAEEKRRYSFLKIVYIWRWGREGRRKKKEKRNIFFIDSHLYMCVHEILSSFFLSILPFKKKKFKQKEKSRKKNVIEALNMITIETIEQMRWDVCEHFFFLL